MIPVQGMILPDVGRLMVPRLASLLAEEERAKGEALIARAGRTDAEVKALEGEVRGLEELLSGMGQGPVLRQVSAAPVMASVARPERGEAVVNPFVALGAALGGGGVLASYLGGAREAASQAHADALERWRSEVAEAAARHEDAMRMWEYGERVAAENAERGERWTDKRLGLMRDIAVGKGKVEAAKGVAQQATSEAAALARAGEKAAQAAGLRMTLEMFEKRRGEQITERREERRHEATIEAIHERGSEARKTEGVKQKGRMELQTAREIADAAENSLDRANELQIARIRAESGATAQTAGERLAELEMAIAATDQQIKLLEVEAERLIGMRSWPASDLQKEFGRPGRKALDKLLERTVKQLDNAHRLRNFQWNKRRNELNAEVQGGKPMPVGGTSGLSPGLENTLTASEQRNADARAKAGGKNVWEVRNGKLVKVK